MPDTGHHPVEHLIAIQLDAVAISQPVEPCVAKLVVHNADDQVAVDALHLEPEAFAVPASLDPDLHELAGEDVRRRCLPLSIHRGTPAARAASSGRGRASPSPA